MPVFEPFLLGPLEQLGRVGVGVADGGFHIQALETPPEPLTLEEKLRTFVKNSLLGLQSKAN